MSTTYGIVLSVTALQGVTMGLYLLTYKSRQLLSNQILSFLLFLLSYVLLTEALRSFGHINYNTLTYYFFIEMSWGIGPLLYLLIRSLFEPKFKISYRSIFLFVPMLVQMAFSAWVKIQNLYWDGTRDSLTYLGYQSYRLWMHTPIDMIVTALLVIISVVFGLKIMREYYESYAHREKNDHFEAILKLYFVFASFTIIISLVDFLFYDFAFNPMYTYPVFIGLGVLTYGLAFFGILRKDFRYSFDDKSSSDEFKPIYDQIASMMHQEKYYLDPDLNTNKLSELTGIKSYLLSKAINSSDEKGVTHFINKHRVEEFKNRVVDPQYDHHTILSIALDSGFNSKASANRIIKNITGKSPKELKKSLISAN